MKVISVSNIADLIEAYILRQLAAKQDGKVELRRPDIADEISCAPSQISYVLSTRFTLDRGYLVESRRGAGGFVRIARLEPAQLTFAARRVYVPREQTEEQTPSDKTKASDEAPRKQTDNETQMTVPELIDRLAAAQMFTRRESVMLQHLFSVLDHFLDEEDQRAVFRQTVHELLAHS